MNEKAHQILTGCTFCVLSTINDSGQPEGAMVGFSHNDQFELIFGTSQQSRKYANLLGDNQLAVTFGPHDNSTVQYQGQAILQTMTDNFKARLEKHFEKLTFARKFLDDPDQVWFVVEPSWLRVSIYGHNRFIEERQF